MVRPVTAQRTKSPGVSTCTSPSRYLSLASPLKPMLRSKRFIKAGSLASCRIAFDHHSVGARRWPARLQQCALLFVARARALRTCGNFPVAAIGLRRYLAIGELDVQTLAGVDLSGAADHSDLGLASEREAAGQR